MAAENAHRRCFLLLFLLSLLTLSTSPVVSRRRSPWSTRSPTTATLDVSATLTQALRAVSSVPSSSSHLLPHNLSSSAIFFRLQSRDFLSFSSGSVHRRHPDYKALTLARLRRDAARVRSIAARVAKEETLRAAAAVSIVVPVVSGASTGSGEYFSTVRVGSPGKPLYMVLDTGSDISWIQCLPCADCYEQSGPIFDPSASSSYAPLSCDSSQCRSLDLSACRNSTSSCSTAPADAGGDGEGSCLYQVAYGDGSYSVGEFATETLTLGMSTPVPGVAIGCGHDNEGLFSGAAGLLALGGGPLSFPSQISARSFSYCLVDRDSNASSALNISAAASATVAAVTVPLVRNSWLKTFYYVEMTGISVGGKMLSVPPSAFAVDKSSGTGGVIVDTGTAVTRLQGPVYAALRNAFNAGAAALPWAAGVSLFDTCYDLSRRASVKVPTVGFHFPGGRELRLPAKNYMVPVDGAGTYCLAFAPTSAPLSIIGNVQQQGIRVNFDLDNALVGFTPHKC